MPRAAQQKRVMVIIKETNKNKLGDRERRRVREVFKEVSTPKIIDFELGREAREKGTLDEEQSRAKLWSAFVCQGGYRAIGLSFR
jgi:hypothetical protein